MNNPSELRASAPVFVPRFDSASEVDGSKNENYSKNKQCDLQTIAKMAVPRDLHSNRRKNHLEEKIDDNSRACRQTCQDKGTGKGKSKGTNDANQNHNNSKCSLNSESKNKGGNRRRTRNRRNYLGQKGKSDRAQFTPYDEETLYHQSFPDIALQIENAFPPLGHAVQESKPSSVWTLTASNHQIFQPLDEGLNDGEKERGDFDVLGLQRLSSSIRNGQRSISSHTKKNPSNSHLSEPMMVTDFEKATANERLEYKPSANQLPHQKPKWNMNHLRNRWWRTLALQRLHRELMEEIKLQFADQCIYTEEASGTSDSDLGSYLEHVELSSLNQPISSEPFIPPTIEDEMWGQRLVGPFPSRTEAVLNAILMNDEREFNAIFYRSRPNDHSAEEMDSTIRSVAQEAIFACVEQDKPHLLRMTLRHQSISAYSRRMKTHETMESQVSPLMLAANLGHNQCLAILLSDEERHSSSLLSRDKDGNNVFHWCCLGRGDEGSLRILLNELSNGSKWKKQVLSKLLLLRNKEGRTSLHVACKNGRVDLVETFLSLCSSSLLSKILSTTDVSNQTPLLAAVASNNTDIVICLIMWRGNNNRNLWKKASQVPYGHTQQSIGLVDKGQESSSTPCALVWAAKNGQIDMIHILLQFSSISGSDYRVSEALTAVIESKNSDEDKSETARILILAGGNAFADSVPISSGSPSSTTTPISVASSYGATGILRTLVQFGREELKAKQQLRRRDPKLQQQPESFFRAIETAENSQMKSAMTNALMESLFYGWQHQETSLGVQHLTSAVALYQFGAQLSSNDVERLWKSMQYKNVQTDFRSTDVKKFRCFATSYLHHHLEPNAKPTSVSDIDRTLLSGHSRLVRGFGWTIDLLARFDCNCAWMARRTNIDMGAEKSRQEDDKVFLVERNGEKLMAHASILSLKSEKLSSAIRFASMHDDTDNTESIPEVFVDIDGRMLRYMLQHIYHGSVFVGWPSNEDEIFCDLLDLMVVAEEALCPSLVQECEMRLLSSNPTRCFCWSCSTAVRYSLEICRHAAECMYLAEGFGTLVTGSRALDVLAITEFVSGFELEYTIRVAPIPYLNTRYISAFEVWEKFDKMWKTTKAIRLLKDQAIMTILLRFSTVIASVSFQESVQYNADQNSSSNLLSHEMLLLQTCLEELHHSSLL